LTASSSHLLQHRLHRQAAERSLQNEQRGVKGLSPKNSMATTYYFLTAPDEPDVLDWFRQQAQRPEEHPNERRTLLFYRQFGPLAVESDGEIDAAASPLITVYLPTTCRGRLWTVGEVHFLAQNMRQKFPELEGIRKRFQSRLEELPIDWERRRDGEEGYGCYLEGMTRNVAERVFAFPQGLAAHKAGQYFVSVHDNDAVLDRICAKLRLRGIDCSPV